MVDMSILTSPIQQERGLEADGPIRTGKPFTKCIFFSLVPVSSVRWEDAMFMLEMFRSWG